ncbi:MAG TPA: hypothetical protein VFN67_07405 [Polyangiales bacterium]|nr:hypothetical protein [Polyangiales bacterium]
MSENLHRSFRLLPSEQLLWHGRPQPGIPRALPWLAAPALFFAFAAVAALFAGLLSMVGIAAVRSTAFLAFYLFMTGAALLVMPHLLLDGCRYAVTDRHVIWARGQMRRVIERRAITYGRIRWHRSVPGVGTLELVRAAPFGPFSRQQRVVLHDVEAPDRLYALIRGENPSEFAGYCDVALTDRLDQGEHVLWGAAPLGWRLGSAELLTAALGAFVFCVGVVYCQRTSSLVMGFERLGLPIRSAIWISLFFAIAITAAVLFTVGSVLLWKGLWGARELGSHTEYILTHSRVLIRRGRIELSIDRRRIVDVAEQPSGSGDLRDLYLILDGPRANALNDSGALGWLRPPRSLVAPVLYEVGDRERFRQLLLGEQARPLRDAA